MDQQDLHSADAAVTSSHIRTLACGGSPRVVIVEDDELVALAIEQLLLCNGYSVLGMFAYGEEAAAFVLDEAPDVALMDINLKGRIDGIATARLVQSVCPGVRIVFVTAESEPLIAERMQAMDPLAILNKPVQPEQMLAALTVTNCPETCSVSYKEAR